MAITRSIPTRPSRSRYALLFAQIMWACLWCNLDSGFWDIAPPSTLGEWQLFIRAILPFGVLPIAIFFLIYRRRLLLPSRSPSRYLMAYGCFAVLGTIFSPEPLRSLYWSITFLASILVAWMFIDQVDPMRSVRQLLLITWVASFTVAAIIAYQARVSVFGDAPSGYDVHVELDWLSRASGVARWAAVPGMVSLVRAYHTRRKVLIGFYIGIAATSFFIVYRMQSRGAIFGSIAALVFALFVSSKMRRYALPLVALAIMFTLILDSPTAVSNRVATYLQRGETREQFLSMTGRTRAYQHGLIEFQSAPVLGRGQWADRLTIGEHVHNSFLQALMNGGILGGIPYCASWVAGWVLFYRLQKRRLNLQPEDRIHVLECGTVMMFFSVRAIPETTTASFAVDLLVMVAIYVYLETLTRLARNNRVKPQLMQFPVAQPWQEHSMRPLTAEAHRRI
jgi:hypothetical protein